MGVNNSDKVFCFWLAVALISACAYMKYGHSEPQKDKESTWEQHVRAEKEARERCAKLGGIVHPGTRQSYTANDIYGGCDFPPPVRP